MLVAPEQLFGLEVDADHLVVVGAEVDLAVVDHRRRDGVGARRQAHHLGPVADAHPVEHLVAPAEVGDAVPDRGGGVHVVQRLVLPDQRAVGGVEGVEEAVVRADQHPVADDHRRRLDLAQGLERPAGLAGRRVDRVEHAPEVADEHEPPGDGRRRLADAQVAGRVLPALFAGVEVEGDEAAGPGADVDRAVGDGRRRVDHLVGLVRPLQRELGRQLGLGHPAERRRAPELRPCIRRGGVGRAVGLGGRGGRRRQQRERQDRNEPDWTAHRRSPVRRAALGGGAPAEGIPQSSTPPAPATAVLGGRRRPRARASPRRPYRINDGRAGATRRLFQRQTNLNGGERRSGRTEAGASAAVAMVILAGWGRRAAGPAR